MTITATKQIKTTDQAKNPVAAARKQDPTALRNKVLEILRKPPKVHVEGLVQQVTDKPDLFDSFGPNVFHGKLK